MVCPPTAKCPKLVFDEHYPGKISFIGHSVGGLIIRRALEVGECVSVTISSANRGDDIIGCTIV